MVLGFGLVSLLKYIIKVTVSQLQLQTLLYSFHINRERLWEQLNAAKSWKCWLNSLIDDVNTVTYFLSFTEMLAFGRLGKCVASWSMISPSKVEASRQIISCAHKFATKAHFFLTSFCSVCLKTLTKKQVCGSIVGTFACSGGFLCGV